MNTTPSRRQRGLTLVECSVAAAIVAVSIGAVAPSFDKMVQRRHVEGAAAQLETDILYARSLAVARNQSLRVSFTSNASVACYVIHTGGAKDCPCNSEGVAMCSNGAEALRTVPFSADAPVAVRSNSGSILADATRGTISPTATMRVEGRGGETLQVVVNIMGRVRACAATAGLPGYPRC